MSKRILLIFLTAVTFLFCCPIIFIVVGSITDPGELDNNLAAVLNAAPGEYAQWSLLPKNPSLISYVEVLFDRPEFFVMFWNTSFVTFGIIGGQLAVAVAAAWGFARYEFRFKNIIFAVYIGFMMLPFQVLMLSEYLVIDRLGFMDTLAAVILPGVFSTFPVFIMYNFFRSIPNALIEAARLDGANEFSVFVRIGIPLGLPGIIAALTLDFFECWTMIEQPMTFLKNKMLWPLSLYLPNIDPEHAGQAFVSSLISLIPPGLVFLLGQDRLEQGIAATATKG
jgi:multiple sugar transport system permease protein